MPLCKNDKNSSYIGTEPSPKGLGYCAHAEKIGTKKKGNDGNMWIVEETKNGRRWIKEPLNDIVFAKLYKWWLKISGGGIIIVYNDRCNIYTSKMVTRNAQRNDIIKKWNVFGHDNNIEAIIWSPMSVDALSRFSRRLVRKIKNDKLKELIKKNKLIEYIMDNYKKFFGKLKLYTDKDYVF